MKKLIYLLIVPLVLFAGKPNLLLLKVYKGDANISGWLMSEKLDGVRAYWDGKKLISRGGHKLSAPKWFTKGFPPFEIDGELWSKRGDFENISGIVRKQNPNDGWKQLTYNIFEVPHQKGNLVQRLDVLRKYLQSHYNAHIKIIKQIVCKNRTELNKYLTEVELKGGEGVVVRNPNAPYINRRTDQALKVKSFLDDECKIVGYNIGKGKNNGLIGSLKCKMKTGQIIKLGSGLSNKERINPPKIGTIVTFKYKGLTKNGRPRFPIFLRIRDTI
ncbi:MAG: DNA ligase [Sulfurospirillaceae bacterium]|nr:DNA ligase [Sulfurospirillaceae bacterium]